ncbi:immunoglobulin-like domain-containing protein [uncultured Exiguobacterium sp.]|uniref:immunoglobulin-like domain-containing protein n=1 Tax=uncultured Exiguobacterium sp. TaxID=202669 RepID=UPI0025F90D28|nr:immunoglobulin-like domain-containing protein [uncultured Exiguobacterium sp.]
MRKSLIVLLCLLLSFPASFQSVAAAKSSSVKKVYRPASTVHYGGDVFAVKPLSPPKTVRVKLANGKKVKRSVKWSSVRFDKKIIDRKQKIKGNVAGTSKSAYWYVTIKNYPKSILPPVVKTVGKNQPTKLPERLSTIFAGGQRYSYPLKWTRTTTASFGNKSVKYTAVGRNVLIAGKNTLRVSDVKHENVRYTPFESGRRLLVTGRILYPAKGMTHHLYLIDDKDRVSMYPLKRDRQGYFRIETNVLPVGRYDVSILSGSQNAAPSTVTIRNVVTPPAPDDSRKILKALLAGITIASPLLQDIQLPQVDGATFSIRSTDGNLSPTGQVIRTDQERDVAFTIVGKLNGLEETRSFSGVTIPKRDLTDEELIDFTLDKFKLGSPLTKDIQLPQAEGITFQLISSNEKIVTPDGKVRRDLTDQLVTLTLKASKGSLEKTCLYSNITVPKVDNATELFLDDYLSRLTFPNPLLKDLVLPAASGTTLSLTSSLPDVLSSTGKVTRGLTDQSLSFLVSATKNGVTRTRSFWNYQVPKRDTAIDELLADYLNKLDIPSTLTRDVTLPTVDGIRTTLSSTNTSILSNAGQVTRGLTDKVVSLTVIATKDGVTKLRTFSNLTIPKKDGATSDLLQNYLDGIALSSPLLSDIVLPEEDGIVATLSSDDTSVLATSGKIKRGLTDKTVSVTIIATKDGVSRTRTFSGLVVPKKEGATEELLDTYLNTLSISNPLTSSLSLPIASGITTSIVSDNNAILSSAGIVTRSSVDQTVTFTITATKDGISRTRTFSKYVVPKKENATVDLLDDYLKTVEIPSPLTADYYLPTPMTPGIETSFFSTNTAVLSNTGSVTRGLTDQIVSVTVTASKDGIIRKKEFPLITIPKQEVLPDALIDTYLNQVEIASPLNQNIQLPPAPEGLTVYLTSSQPDVVGTSGVVKLADTAQSVTVSVTAVLNGVSKTKMFSNLSVPARPLTVTEELTNYLKGLSITGPLKTNLSLDPPAGIDVRIEPSVTSLLSSTGILTRDIVDRTTDITIIASKNGISLSKQFESISVPKRALTDAEELQKYLDQLTLPSLLTEKLNLIDEASAKGITVTLSSSNTAVLLNDGSIIPAATNTKLSLTVTAKKGEATETKTFDQLTVPMKDPSAADIVQSYLDSLSIPNILTTNLVLQAPTGITVSIKSDKPSVVASGGVVTQGLTDELVDITITATKDSVTKNRTITGIKVPLSPTKLLDKALQDLSLSSLTDLTSSLNLPTQINGLPITWKSSNTNIISNTGTIIPAVSSQAFSLTAWITKDGVLKSKTFDGTIAGNLSLILKEDLARIAAVSPTLNVYLDLKLPTTLNGSPLTWKSSNESLLTSLGIVKNRSQITPFTLSATTGNTSSILSLATQDTQTSLLSSLLNVLGGIVNPIVDSLTLGKSASLPQSYGGVLGIGSKSISEWKSSHPDIVTIQGSQAVVTPDKYEHLVVLFAKFGDVPKPVPFLIKVPAKK